jgi:medium-chain acyl-[acyl-carrier-protein] hydrolase
MHHRYQAIPETLLTNPEALLLFVPAMRADMKLVENWDYRPGLPLEIPLLALGGEMDQFAPPDDIRAWQMHTRGGFEAHFWPGGHFYLHDYPDRFLSFLAAKLRVSA